MDENNLTQTPERKPVPVSMEDGLPEAAEPDQAGPERDAPGDGWNIPRTTVTDVRFKEGGKVYYFDPGGLAVKTGDHVIVETARGVEYGVAANGLHQVPTRDITGQLRPVLRLATAADEKTHAANKSREKEAYRICQQEIERLGLEMQLASAEVAFDGSKILFFFTADGRVDFRELVKSLASAFRTRIELRQIGVRDKARMIGGLGLCGRPFCCSEFLTDFQPVSIKMAKTQNLSLNPAKISGTCGRLMCCLKYEQEAYEDLLKTVPKNESFVDTPDGRGTVTDVNLLRQTVRVRMEKQPDTIGCYHSCDVCVWRNGKAKKTDPPIPDDWAPVSSDPNRRKPEETPDIVDYLSGKRAAGPGTEPPKAAAPTRRGGRGGQSRPRAENQGEKRQESAQPAAPQEKRQQPQGQRKKQQRAARPQQPQPSGQPQGQRKKQGAPAPAARQAAAPAPDGGEQKKRAGGSRRRRKPSGGSAAPGKPTGGDGTL